MDESTIQELAETLHERRGAIAASWHAAIAHAGYGSTDSAEVRQRLIELTEQAITLLLMESLDRHRAQMIGASLVDLDFIQPEALSRTQDLLAGQLVEGLSGDQVATLQPRLIRLLSELAAGFSRRIRERILDGQEEIRNAVMLELQDMAKILRESRDELDQRVQTRTAEVAAINERLRERNRQLTLLDRAGRLFTTTLDLDQVLTTVLEEVRHLMSVTAVSIWLIDPETDELICRQSTGPQNEIVRGWRLPMGEGFVGWVARHGKSLIVPDSRIDPRHFKKVDQETRMELRSIVSVPLPVKQKVIGVIQVLDRKVGRFKLTDLALLEPLAASAAIAIENARLVEALHHYTAELEVRNRELDAFAHTVAHDLKSPLALVIGFAQVLETSRSTMPEQELNRYLQMIADTGRKMCSIIEELLLLAGVRQQDVKASPLDMASILAEARQRLLPVAEKQRAEITLPDSWPAALGHAPWIEEVWVNYLSNALKYGGRPPRIELGATEQQDGMVRFWVRDDGPGLTPEEQARLFVPFTRLDRVRLKGHGLGLSIVRRIVEKLGGQVGVESEPGRGSTFFFTLPSAATAPSH